LPKAEEPLMGLGFISWADQVWLPDGLSFLSCWDTVSFFLEW